MATRAAQRGLAAAGLALVFVAGSAAQTRTHLHPVLLHVIGTRIYAGSRPLTAGAQPTWSPDGSQIAFVRGRSVWTANADGSGPREIAKGTAPTWTAGGDLAYVHRGTIIVGGRLVLPGHNPDFDRDGRLAYDRNGSVWAANVRLTLGTDPAWAPHGRSLAFVREGSLYSIGSGGQGETLLVDAGDVSEPAWSPDGRQVLFVSGGAIHAVSVSDSSVVRVARGVSPELALVPRGREILPDLKQLPPTNIYITHRPGYRLLAFRSAAANIGRGLLWIRGRRPPGHRLMDVTQLIRRTDGTIHEVATNGWMRYDVTPTHSHWHFHPFERYELWYPGGYRPVARDHKQGFCLGDRHPLAGARPPHYMPGECGLFEPHARSVEEGISPRYVDIYPPEYHGQWIVVNGLRDGRYVLVHRVNPAFALRESSYANNEAAALIEIRGDSVRVLKTCPTSVTCGRYGHRR